jgi:hypothetical protein
VAIKVGSNAKGDGEKLPPPEEDQEYVGAGVPPVLRLSRGAAIFVHPCGSTVKLGAGGVHELIVMICDDVFEPKAFVTVRVIV